MATAIAPGPFAKAHDADTPAPLRDPRYDNEPPLEERLLMDFMEELDREGITSRIQQLIANAQTCKDCPDEMTAGKIGDLSRMAGEVSKKLEVARDKFNRPLLNAQRSLKAKADALLSPLTTEVLRLRNELTRFAREQAAKAEEVRRAREEERRRAEEALREANISEDVIAETVPEPVKVEAAPVARGDLGARVGTRKVWKHEIESVRQVPDRFLKHPKVVEALDTVLGRAIREGERAIKGVRIWSEDDITVR